MTETLRENGGSWAEELAEAPARQRKSRPSKASNSRGSTPGGTPRSRKAQAAGEGFRHALEAQLRAQQNHAGNSAKASLLHRYQITPNILGEGATGKVKAAVHRETGQKVAIKTFRWNKLCESAKADVLRESGIQCSLDHPKIAKAREMVKTGERLYLVLEMLEGGDVLDRLHEAEHLTERLAMRVVKQVLEAIQYMHSNGMVHRDIKPDNIVFESVDRDQVKLIDFGLCCEWHEGMAPMMRRCGTEFYMAPEVHEGSYTNKVDIWSLGAAAHAMLTGQVIGRRRDGSASFGPLLSRCSPQCQHFVEALLAKDPERRPTAKQALDHPWLEESDKFLKLMGNEIGSSRPTTLTNSHLNMRHVSSMSSCSYFTPPFAANVSGCSPTESLRSLPCGSSRETLRYGSVCSAVVSEELRVNEIRRLEEEKSNKSSLHSPVVATQVTPRASSTHEVAFLSLFDTPQMTPRASKEDMRSSWGSQQGVLEACPFSSTEGSVSEVPAGSSRLMRALKSLRLIFRRTKVKKVAPTRESSAAQNIVPSASAGFDAW
mmetsp:Transcript_58802/g.172569  ORF Transcript_58802/g.172569 Transcript_58802/m.172569 type:complete len:545 (+) Transcript_58802:234-1868(+)